MSDITETNNIMQDYDLPHHGVVKEDSSTTKLRVVFDGSAKTTTSVSLHDTVMVDSKIQENLISILLRYRVHQAAMTADIEQMFRQINVDTKDAEYQKILWHKNVDEEIKGFRLITVTYGKARATYLSVRTL